MNILKQLSIRNLKLNIKRTISTIIGIILSVALICAVSTMVSSFQATLIENAINETGYYHLKVGSISDSDIKTLQNNRDVKEIFTSQTIGFSKLEGGQNEYKPYLKLYSMNKDVFEKLKLDRKLLEGRFPENTSEILISRHISSNGKVDYKIGDKINLKVGERRAVDDYKLYDSDSYQEEGEKLENVKDFEFTVVGIIERPNFAFEDYSTPGYTVITTEISSGRKDVYIALKNPKDNKKAISQILDVKDYTDMREGEIPKYIEYDVNKELLRWEGFAFSDSTIAMLFAVCGVVIFIIIFTSVFCIKNSFEIATSEKTKMYGMLSSVGATKKQIKKNVIFESMILGLIGIPFGILSGIFADFILIKIVNSLIGEYLLGHVDGIILNVAILPIIISVLLGVITIYISAISSAKKASRVSPMENLRNSEEIKLNSKKLKTPKIIEKIFKQGGVLAYKNLKRSKKKYRTTVMSLTISIFIFITMNSFITNSFNFTSNYYKDIGYNLRVYGREKNITENEIKQIENLEDVKKVSVLYESNDNYLEIEDFTKIVQIEGVDYIKEDNGEINYINIGGKNPIARMMFKSLNDKDFKEYVKTLGLNYEQVKKDGILIDISYDYDEEENLIEKRRYTYNENDIITGKIKDEEFNIKVASIALSNDNKPKGLENNYYTDGYLVINKDEYSNIDFEVSCICIDSSNADKTEEDIKKINNDLRISNFDAQVREERSMVLVVKIFLYGFITVITFIGVTNIFNSITSNMELRQKEFAMLKSIGMTKKEFNRMINLETIFYSTKALLYGVILGLLGTFALYKSFSVKMDESMYIPIIPIIISAIGVFILVYVIMKYSLGKINKQNTIETIRKENI